MIFICHHRDRYDFDCPRVYVGRGHVEYYRSPLANPYRITKDRSRTQAIREYRSYLWKHIDSTEIADELDTIVNLAQEGDVVLVCWCSPLACHADVIKACVEWKMGGSERPVSSSVVRMDEQGSLGKTVLTEDSMWKFEF